MKYDNWYAQAIHFDYAQMETTMLGFCCDEVIEYIQPKENNMFTSNAVKELQHEVHGLKACIYTEGHKSWTQIMTGVPADKVNRITELEIKLERMATKLFMLTEALGWQFEKPKESPARWVKKKVIRPVKKSSKK